LGDVVTIVGDDQVERAAASGRRWRNWMGIGLLGSVMLHGFILALCFVLARTPKDDYSDYFPVEIVLADQTASPRQADKAIVPQQEAGTPSLPAAQPPGAAPSNNHPDDLEIKLHRLAQLQQPNIDLHVPARNAGLSRMSATSADAAAGSMLFKK
jgi:hypothetical protein